MFDFRRGSRPARRLAQAAAPFVLAVSIAVLGLASPAAAATSYPGINAVLSEAINRQVQALCHTPEEWAALGAEHRFDPARVLGYVTRWSADGGVTWWPEPSSHQAPGICERVEAFRASPTRETQKLCQDGFDEVPRTEYRLEERVRTETRVKYVQSRRWVAVTRKGKRAKILRPYRKRVEYQVEVVYTVEVPVTVYDQVPRIVTCADWGEKTKALHVMIHEAGHMGGIHDERVDDGWAMRNLDWFAWRLGAQPDFARELQADEWSWYSGHPYFDPACVRD
jgi:hypothetical protein